MITPIEFRTPPRKGKVAGVALWALVAAVLWASSSVPCQAALTLAQVEFSAVPGEGVLYPLRKGQSDQNDLYPAPYVKWETGNPPTMEGAPGCFLRNTRLRSSVTVNWAPPPPLMNPRGVELTLILKKFAENGELTDIWQWTSAITPVQPNTSITLDCPSVKKFFAPPHSVGRGGGVGRRNQPGGSTRPAGLDGRGTAGTRRIVRSRIIYNTGLGVHVN